MIYLVKVSRADVLFFCLVVLSPRPIYLSFGRAWGPAAGSVPSWAVSSPDLRGRATAAYCLSTPPSSLCRFIRDWAQSFLFPLNFFLSGFLERTSFSFAFVAGYGIFSFLVRKLSAGQGERSSDSAPACFPFTCLERGPGHFALLGPPSLFFPTISPPCGEARSSYTSLRCRKGRVPF